MRRGWPSSPRKLPGECGLTQPCRPLSLAAPAHTHSASHTNSDALTLTHSLSHPRDSQGDSQSPGHTHTPWTPTLQHPQTHRCPAPLTRPEAGRLLASRQAAWKTPSETRAGQPAPAPPQSGSGCTRGRVHSELRGRLDIGHPQGTEGLPGPGSSVPVGPPWERLRGAQVHQQVQNLPACPPAGS